MSGLGFPGLDFGGVAALANVVTGFIASKDQAKVQKKAIAVEAAKLKAAKEQFNAGFAFQQAQALVEPEAKARQSQIVALYGVAAIALIVSGAFVVGAIRGRKKE